MNLILAASNWWFSFPVWCISGFVEVLLSLHGIRDVGPHLAGVGRVVWLMHGAVPSQHFIHAHLIFTRGISQKTADWGCITCGNNVNYAMYCLIYWYLALRTICCMLWVWSDRLIDLPIYVHFWDCHLGRLTERLWCVSSKICLLVDYILFIFLLKVK